MSKIKITIGIACFNAAKTIARAIDSALSQDYKNVEIIVVDDASEDASLEIIKTYANNNNNIRLLKHKINIGYPAAVNQVFRHATGEFIAIFDADDVSEPSRLDKQLNKIISFRKKGINTYPICYCNRKVIIQSDHNFNDEHIGQAIGRNSPEPNGLMVADYLLGCEVDNKYSWGIFGSCTWMLHKETIKTIGFMDESFRRCAEWDYAVRAAQKDFYFIAVNEPLVHQYKTKGAYKSNKIPLKYSLLLRKKYKDYLNKKGMYIWSMMFARVNFYNNKKQYLLSNLYILSACLLQPHIAFNKFKKKFVSNH